jgi:hypothetical protein
MYAAAVPKGRRAGAAANFRRGAPPDQRRIEDGGAPRHRPLDSWQQLNGRAAARRRWQYARSLIAWRLTGLKVPAKRLRLYLVAALVSA